MWCMSKTIDGNWKVCETEKMRSVHFLATFGNGSSGGGDGGGSNSPSKRLSGRDMLQA